ncbi:MAG: hypothetical protein B9S32_10835 [Verrucomicrobia bacterium Tous-C9LFEB]|nr:MAG: hypothetical protein B9S32_10835 [Verrucomicrobia bacterium Tous-C9LFEB]
MKKLLSLLSLFAIVAHTQGQELLAKYDFESDAKWLPKWGAGLGSKYAPATGWKKPFVVTLEKGDSHSGDACLKMEILESVPNEKILHTDVFTIPAPDEGKKVRITICFYVRAQGLAEKSLHLRGLEKDELNKTLKMVGDSKSLVAIPLNAEWAEVRWTGTLNPKTRGLMVMLAVTSTDAPAAFWLDDLSVEIAPEPVPVTTPTPAPTAAQ